MTNSSMTTVCFAVTFVLLGLLPRVISKIDFVKERNLQYQRDDEAERRNLEWHNEWHKKHSYFGISESPLVILAQNQGFQGFKDSRNQRRNKNKKVITKDKMEAVYSKNNVIHTPGKECSIGWVFNKADELCYISSGIFNPENKVVNHTEAKRQCEKHGYRLAEPRTKETNDFLTDNSNLNPTWIGLVRNSTGSWVWESGSDDTWTKWAKNRPAAWEQFFDPNYFDCGVKLSDGGEWFNSDDCSRNGSYVCTKPAAITGSPPTTSDPPLIKPTITANFPELSTVSVGTTIKYTCTTPTPDVTYTWAGYAYKKKKKNLSAGAKKWNGGTYNLFVESYYSGKTITFWCVAKRHGESRTSDYYKLHVAALPTTTTTTSTTTTTTMSTPPLTTTTTATTPSTTYYPPGNETTTTAGSTTDYPDYTTPWPTARPSPQPSQCKDLKDTCVEWLYMGYCTNEEYRTYMTVYCRKSCNMCTGASAAMNNQGDPCYEVQCSSKEAWVCGDDDVSYRNDCYLINARKCGKNVIMFKHWGCCKNDPTCGGHISPSPYTMHPTWRG